MRSWKLPNVRIIADKLAAQHGLTAFVPDFHGGDSVEHSIVDVIVNPAPGIGGRIWQGVRLVASAPSFLLWLRRHDDEFTTPLITRFFDALVENFPAAHTGVVGYCWGARPAMALAGSVAPARVGAVCVAHPSFMNHEDVKALARPALFILADYDNVFTPAVERATREALASKPGVEFKKYPAPTQHGFAVRGGDQDPIVRDARQDAVNTMAAFFQRTLA
jgi:dienelactone hydrolase